MSLRQPAPLRDERSRPDRAFRTALDRLESLLESKSKSRRLFFRLETQEDVLVGLAPMLVRRAEELTRRVWAEGGLGSLLTEHDLLAAVASVGDPGSLPFFRECLERGEPRKPAPKRREIAIAGVAVLAQMGSSDAKEELRKGLAAPDARLRAAAVNAARNVFGAGLPGDLLADLERIARDDGAFAPRFLARGTLGAIGAETVIDVPQGSYTFTATLPWAKKAKRTVELSSKQSLHVLAAAVLDAYGWDSDHLYCFYFDQRDRRGPLTIDDDMDGPIGALGLAKGQRFVFHFDFGADHLFDVAVDAIAERAPARVKLPRVVARTGARPKQYRSDD